MAVSSSKQKTIQLNFISLLFLIQIQYHVFNYQIFSSYIIMGNSNTSEFILQKGEGFRILEIKQNSPFIGKVQEYFDFIIQVIPPPAEKTASDILDKLAAEGGPNIPKSPLQIINQNVDKNVSVKIVSTKYRSVRTIQITPKIRSSSNNDAIGLLLRKERYDEVFDTYFPVTDIQNNSPAKKAGIKQGQYLIGCAQFPYKTIDAFTEGLYERFFNKQIQQKTVHLVIYDLATDNLRLRQVALKRGWGGKGLLGCQFLQGILNKFPSNLQVQRVQLRKTEKKKQTLQKIRNQLGQCDGASKSLIEALQSQKNKRAKHFKNIKNLLNLEPPKIFVAQKQEQKKENKLEVQKIQRSQSLIIKKQQKKIEQLQMRVQTLEDTLFSVRQYLSKAQQLEEAASGNQ